jgi:hypothetical protein
MAAKVQPLRHSAFVFTFAIMALTGSSFNFALAPALCISLIS